MLTWAAFALTGTQIAFDLEVQDYLLVVFFATIGLNARISDLFLGGRLLGLLLVITLGFMMCQNLVGLAVTFFDLPAATSVLVGSASLIGGAWDGHRLGPAD